MKKRTYEEVKNEIEKCGCELISTEYNNARDKMDIKFPCGHIQKNTFDGFNKIKDKSLCKKCKKIGGKTTRLTYENVKENIEKEGYLLKSSEYKNAHTLLQVCCPKGHDYRVEWANWQQGYRCPYCSGTKKKEIDEIKNYIENEGYELLSEEYKNNQTHIKVCCGKHEPYYVTFSNFQQGKRCPHCIQSKGEKRIADILDKNNILYIRQYKFDDCRNTKPLPFDFYLTSYNILIEYDGQQHFEPRFGTSKEEFEIQKQRDIIKNAYCENNNIKLIRIPYWEFDNIEKILNAQIKNFND